MPTFYGRVIADNITGYQGALLPVRHRTKVPIATSC